VDVLVCVKRVPDTGGKVTLTGDRRQIETGNLEFAISPHEECAVEEAIRLTETHGGEATVLSLGPAGTTEQLREAIAKGVHQAILLESDADDWDAHATARAIVAAVREKNFDLLLFGNEAADLGQYQVGPRVATLLGLPCVTGVKSLSIADGRATAKRQEGNDWAVFELPLPAVISVKEGINKPRHPSLRGIMAAKRAPLEQVPQEKPAPRMVHQALRVPEESRGELTLLGEGKDAVPKLVETLKELGVL
jgi:electron transfer flavoprotein beta subunit